MRPSNVGDDLQHERAILREGDRVERIERLHERDRVAVAELRVDEVRERGPRARRGVAGCT